MTVMISTILLREGQRLPVANIEREIRSRYPELQVSLTNDAADTPSFDLKTGQLILGNMPAPYPWTDLEGPCATSILWKNAAEEVKAHQTHLIVTVLSNLDPVEKTILLTQCTAAVLAACDAAIGVYWGNATLVVPKNIFMEFAEKVLPHGPPLDIWVDFRVGWKTSTTSAGFTQGMRALGHMEMEILEIPEKPAELRQRFQDLASYLLKNGAVIRDGHTVGQDANEKIRAIYSESSFGNTQRVMRLHYEASPKRPWWKLI
jgi:hypothetical protein